MDQFQRIFFGIIFIFQASVGLAGPQSLKAETFTVCGRKVSLEVARTPAELAKGLGERDDLNPNTGMAFIFDRPQELVFWMKGVSFDIDIGFFDKNGKLRDAQTMKGESIMTQEAFLPKYTSPADVLYAIELPKGFFKKSDRKNCSVKPLPASNR